jgi:hypothetical protein
MLFSRCVVVALAAAALGSGCSRGEAPGPSVATPSVSFSRPRAPLGSPIKVTYKFQVAANAPAFDQDYRVFVHFLDADDERLWTDDHDPDVPTSQWKAGQTVQYTRTMFVPVNVTYIGDAKVQLGLYSTRDQRRLTLAGVDSGQQAYTVATLGLQPTSENVFLLFKDGWNNAEVAPDNPTVEWQWSKRIGVLAFRNPKKDVLFYLHADNPAAFAEPQTATIKVNGTQVDQLAITPRKEVLHTTRIPAAQLGGADMVELTLEVDKTYVPALIPSANSRDPRELGLRVFHAFVEPQS